MRPYYEDDHVTIYHGDALETLDGLKASSVGAIVTDPPYVIGALSAGNMASKSGSWADMMNSVLWFESWYRKAARILHSTGSFWSFCNWRSLPVVMRAANGAGLPITSVAVWDKEWIGPGGSQGLRPSYELVMLSAKEGFAIRDRGIPDVIRHKVGGYKPNGHPAEKPVDLVRRILRLAFDSDAPRVACDPFMGSGTTLVAARTEGVRAIGIEAEEKWCEIAARRMGQEVLPL